MIRKNICILSHGPVSNDGRILKTIDFFISKGLSVFVFSPIDISEPSENNFEKPGVHFFAIEKKNSFFIKLLRHTAFPFEFDYLAKEARKAEIRYDYIYVNDLPCLSAGRKIQKMNPGSRLIYDSHEIFTETINQFFPETDAFHKKWLFKFLISTMRFFGTQVEKKLGKKVDLFITVNDSLKAYFESKYGLSNVEVVMNCPQAQKGTIPQNLKVNFRTQFNWAHDSRVFLYQGAWNKGRGLELLITTFRLTPEHFKLVIIGKGVLEPRMKKLIDQLKLEERVKLFGFVNYDQLPDYTVAADVGINLLEPFNLSKAMASPNKLFEYIHAGIPVLCSDTPENRKVIEQYNVGVLVQNNEESVLDGLLFFNSEANILQKKEHIKDASKVYNWANQVLILDEFLNKSTNN